MGLTRQQIYQKRHRERLAEYHRQWKSKNPEKALAHRLVSKAIKSGELVKPDRCVECKEERRLSAHHHDYSKPLDVEWLCNGCHRLAHNDVPTGPRKIYHGDEHVSAKLTESKVMTIKSMLNAGESVRAIGRTFGVNEATIRLIKRGVTWKHVKSA